MAKSYLEANGVETIMQDEMMAQVNIYSNAVGGVKLLIKEQDKEAGLKLLKDGGYIIDENSHQYNKVEVILPNESANKAVCPFCGSGNISRTKDPGLIMIAINFILGPPFKSSYKCFDCNKAWKYKR